jgi:hypothetical protein
MRIQVAFPFLAIACLGWLVLGCRPNDEEKDRIKTSLVEGLGVEADLRDASATPPAPPLAPASIVEPVWFEKSLLPWDHWEIQTIGNQPVGYVHRRVERSEVAPDCLRLSAESRTRFRGREKEVTQEVNIVSIEKENGELLHFEGDSKTGNGERRWEAKVRNGKLVLRTGQSQLGRETLRDWTPSDRGPFAIEQSLMRSPMKEGEQRFLRYFDPILGKSIDVQLTAYDYFDTPTFQGKKERLLEIQINSSSEDGGSRSQLWVDEQGRGYKSYLPALDLMSFRCDEESAMVVVDQANLSSIRLHPITVAGTAFESFAPGPLRFEVKVLDLDPSLSLASGTRQVVKPIKDRTFDVTVFPASQSERGMEGLNTEEPIPSDEALASSFVIDSNHPQIRLLAKTLLEEEGLASDAPVDLRVFAFHKGIRARVQFIPSDASALVDGEVSRGRATLAAGKGDSFAHAALLAAVCRADGIPSRVAIGLRCNRETRPLVMRLHAWTEIHTGQTWLPFDSSVPDVILPADRIKWIDTMWNTINPYDDILRVADQVKDLEINALRYVP